MGILARKNGFALAHDDLYDNYYFGTETELKRLFVPCNQYGTKKEIISELERWKNEVDSDNSEMLEVENLFISILS